MESLGTRLVDSLFRPIDIASLVYARIAFGLIMLWEVWRYFAHNRIFRYWIDPEYHFPYPGFEWLSPLPGDGMYWLFIGMGILSVLIMVGFLYRFATILFCLSFCYMFLLEQGQYLNHFYLVCLLSFLFIFLPAHRSFSLDARLGIVSRSDRCPAWALWILRFQLGVVYFYGGIAKLNGDWLAGEPLRDWLAGRADKPVVGEYLAAEPVVMTLAWGGMLFDLLIPFLLLWKPTRLPAFAVAVFFHLGNAFLWSIGIFPWMSIALTALFLPPSWPRRLLRIPRSIPDLSAGAFSPGTGQVRIATALLAIWCGSQLLIPLRHWIFPGDVVWTEEGHRFSWRMKLRSRDGLTDFHLIETESGRIHAIDPYDYLPYWQIVEVDTNPTMILRFARILKSDFEGRTGKEVSVHAHSVISVNDRPDQAYFSAEVDLSRISAFDRRREWMYPFRSERTPDSAEPALVLD